MTSPFISTEITILVLLLVACIGSIYFKRFHLPYTVGLVIVGLLLGFVGKNYDLPIQKLVLSPDIILFLFVPPLVFASASNIDHRLFIHNLKPALTLAGPGLVISTAIIGGLLTLFTPLNLGETMLFGALISATDPVAVVALFEELGVPKRLNMIVDEESMLNDATAIVAFELVLSIIEAGTFESNTISHALVEVMVVLLGGIVVGFLTGTLMGFAIKIAKDNPLVQASISLLVAYISFIIAQNYLKVSGVIAVMTAGLMVGRYKAYNLTPDIRKYLNEFWQYISFLANSLIFLLVGLTSSSFIQNLPLDKINFWVIIIVTIIISYLARGVMVFGVINLVNPFLKDGPINWQYQLVTFWGGLRGAVALALALSLPPDFPNRELLIAMTLAVALFSILVSGTTVEKLLKILGLEQPPFINQMAEKQALLIVKTAVSEKLNSLSNRAVFSHQIIQTLQHQYHQEVENSLKSLDHFRNTLREQSFDLNAKLLWLEITNLEKQNYEIYYDLGFLTAKTLDYLKFMINLIQANIEEGKIPPPYYSFESLRYQGEGFFTSLMRRFAPQSAWLQHKDYTQIQSEYEFYLVVIKVSQIIIDKLQQSIKAGVILPELGQDCLTFYQFVQEKGLEKQQIFASQQSGLDQVLQQRIMHQAILVYAQEKLVNLINQGFISEEMAETIKQELKADI